MTGGVRVNQANVTNRETTASGSAQETRYGREIVVVVRPRDLVPD